MAASEAPTHWCRFVYLWGGPPTPQCWSRAPNGALAPPMLGTFLDHNKLQWKKGFEVTNFKLQQTCIRAITLSLFSAEALLSTGSIVLLFLAPCLAVISLVWYLKLRTSEAAENKITVTSGSNEVKMRCIFASSFPKRVRTNSFSYECQKVSRQYQ